MTINPNRGWRAPTRIAVMYEIEEALCHDGNATVIIPFGGTVDDFDYRYAMLFDFLFRP